MKKIHFKGHSHHVPGMIDELTPDQYRAYLVLCSGLLAGVISLATWRERWFCTLVDYSFAKYRILRESHRVPALVDQVTAPFLDDTPDGPRPRLMTCKNLLPTYNGYSGPADWLNDVTFGDFVKCATLMQADAGAVSPETADEVARTLYRIPDDKPVPELLSVHAVNLFGSLWRELQAGPIDINGRRIDFRILFQNGPGSKRPDDSTGWSGVTFEVAATGVFGTVDQLERQPFWPVLIYLYKCKFEYLHEKTDKP